MIVIEEKKSLKVPGNTSLFISFPYHKELVDIIKNSEVSVYDKNTKIWEIPLTDLQKFLDASCLFDSITLHLMKDKNEKQQEEVEFKTKFKTKLYEH